MTTFGIYPSYNATADERRTYDMGQAAQYSCMENIARNAYVADLSSSSMSSETTHGQMPSAAQIAAEERNRLEYHNQRTNYLSGLSYMGREGWRIIGSGDLATALNRYSLFEEVRSMSMENADRFTNDLIKSLEYHKIWCGRYLDVVQQCDLVIVEAMQVWRLVRESRNRPSLAFKKSLGRNLSDYDVRDLQNLQSMDAIRGVWKRFFTDLSYGPPINLSSDKVGDWFVSLLQSKSVRQKLSELDVHIAIQAFQNYQYEHVNGERAPFGFHELRVRPAMASASDWKIEPSRAKKLGQELRRFMSAPPFFYPRESLEKVFSEVFRECSPFSGTRSANSHADIKFVKDEFKTIFRHLHDRYNPEVGGGRSPVDPKEPFADIGKLKLVASIGEFALGKHISERRG